MSPTSAGSPDTHPSSRNSSEAELNQRKSSDTRKSRSKIRIVLDEDYTIMEDGKNERRGSLQTLSGEVVDSEALRQLTKECPLNKVVSVHNYKFVSFPGQSSAASCITLSPGVRFYLYSVVAKNRSVLTAVNSGRPIALGEVFGVAQGACWDSRGHMFLTSNSDVLQYDVGASHMRARFAHPSPVCCVLCEDVDTAQPRRLYCGLQDGQCYVWTLACAESATHSTNGSAEDGSANNQKSDLVPFVVKHHAAPICYISTIPSVSLICSLCHEGPLVAWDAKDGIAVRSLATEGGFIACECCHSDECRVAAATSTRLVVWEVTSEEVISSWFVSQVAAAAESPTKDVIVPLNSPHNSAPKVTIEAAAFGKGALSHFAVIATSTKGVHVADVSSAEVNCVVTVHTRSVVHNISFVDDTVLLADDSGNVYCLTLAVK